MHFYTQILCLDFLATLTNSISSFNKRLCHNSSFQIPVLLLDINKMDFLGSFFKILDYNFLSWRLIHVIYSSLRQLIISISVLSILIIERILIMLQFDVIGVVSLHMIGLIILQWVRLAPIIISVRDILLIQLVEVKWKSSCITLWIIEVILPGTDTRLVISASFGGIWHGIRLFFVVDRLMEPYDNLFKRSLWEFFAEG